MYIVGAGKIISQAIEFCVGGSILNPMVWNLAPGSSVRSAITVSVEKATKKKQTFLLENNSVFVMGGTCQKTHKHGLPKRKKVKDYRISLTFREFRGAAVHDQ